MFQGLETLYEALDERLPTQAGNPCGDCRACCTATGVDRHSLSELELDYIEHTLGGDKIHAFHAFTRRLRDESGEILFETCPFYDLANRGCSIHEQRPFSCRTFGHFRLEGTQFPEECVFEGSETMVSRGGGFREIPLADELQRLARDYWPYTGPRIVGYGAVSKRTLSLRPRLDSEESSDPFSAALIALARGENEKAVAQLSEAEGSDAFRLHHLGVALSCLQRHEEAHRVFSACLQLAPQSWEVSYQLGLNLQQLGDEKGAFRMLARTTQLNPLHALAWSFLGYLSLQAGFEEKAREFLTKGLELDPENEAVRARLDSLNSKTGN